MYQAYNSRLSSDGEDCIFDIECDDTTINLPNNSGSDVQVPWKSLANPKTYSQYEIDIQHAFKNYKIGALGKWGPYCSVDENCFSQSPEASLYPQDMLTFYINTTGPLSTKGCNKPCSYNQCVDTWKPQWCPTSEQSNVLGTTGIFSN